MSLSSIFRRGPLRFGVLIAFIILAAALARLAELPTGWILAVIAIAWLLAALIERSVQRAAVTATSTPATAAARAPAAVEPESAPVHPRPAASRDDELWLADDAVIDPAPAPAVRRQHQPAPASVPVTAAKVAGEEPAAAAELVPEPAAATELVPEPVLVLPPPGPPSSSSLPRGSWNLWELEGIARETTGVDAARDEERSLILMYLREFASAEGILGAEFDDLVRESFGDLLPAR